MFPEAGSGQKVCQSTETEQVGDEEEANVNVTFAGADEILTGSDGLDVSDPTTGTSWHSAPTNVGLPGAPVADSLPAIVNGVVFITENGTLVAYDLNGCGSAICAPIWQTTFVYGDPGPPYFQPTVANNTIYVWGPNAIDSWQVAPLPAHIVRPGAPYDVTVVGEVASSTEPGTYTVNWAGPHRTGTFPIIGYEARSSRGADAVVPWNQDATISATADTEARISVRAITVAGYGRWSLATAEIPVLTPPPGPPDVKASPGPGAGEASLTWTNPQTTKFDPLTTYNVFAIDNDNSYYSLGASASPSPPSKTIEGLQSGNSYQFYLHNQEGDGGISNPVTIP